MNKNILYVALAVSFAFIGNFYYNFIKTHVVVSIDSSSQVAQVVSGNLYTVCSLGCTNTTIQGLFNSITLGSDDVVEVRADSVGGSKTYLGAVRVSGNGTSGHPIILRARAGDNITIDAQNSVGNALYVGANYFVVDGINVKGAQGAQILVGQVGTCGSVRNTDITVKNSSAYIASPDGNQNHNGINVGCANNVILKNNTITTSSANLGGGDSDCFYASSFNGLTFDGNTCTISNSATDVGTAAPHNDGLQISGGNGTNFPLGSAANLTIKNNSFIHVGNRQGYKQCIYVEYEVQGSINIFNNVCKDTASPNNHILSVANKGFGTQGKVRIYNNSIFINGSPVASIITDEGVHNPSIKNNIVLWSGTNDYQTCVSANSSTLTPSEIDNNLCYKVGGTVLQNQANKSFYPWTNWKSLGYDVHGYNTLPQYVDQTNTPYDLHLQSTSPAINKGADLSPYFTIDKDGNTRGIGGAWDIGAYEYTGTTSPPSSIAGSCGVTYNTCISGTFSDITDSTTHYLWSCNGSNGGSNASCSVAKPTTSTTYVLTVNSGSGSGTYAVGTAVTISANTAPSGQVFDKWTGATVANATSSSTTITMPASATSVTATYKAVTYALTVTSGSGGGSYAAGTSVAITANTAPTGQVFDKWTGATVANATSQTTTLTMPSSATSVTATFSLISTNAVIDIGSRIIVSTSKLKVRSAPGTASSGKVSIQKQGAMGTVTEGSVIADGYTWWKINFDSGVDGWVAGDYIRLLTN